VEGITVKDHLANSGGILPPEQARNILMPVMDALREVHAVNILHRDISPDNIFINKKGQVILIDFGAARQAIGEKGRSLSIILKPGYAPEEQYRTKGIQGPWTDIYAIAATYYHLITGHQPPEALERLVEDPLELPSGLGVAISGNEEKALLKALAVRAADRFQTIDDFQNSLLGEGPAAGFKAAPVPVAVSSERPSPASAGAALAVKSKLPMKLVAIAAAAVLLIGGSLLAYNIFAAGGENEEALAPEVVEEEPSVDENENSLPEDEEPAEPEAPAENEEEPTEEEKPVDPEPEPEPQPTPEPEPEPEPEPPAPGDPQEIQNMPYEGGLYSGALKDGVPHGQGRWTHPNGLNYVGEFTNGSVTGYGTLAMPNGDRYVGYLVKGVPNGQGKLKENQECRC